MADIQKYTDVVGSPSTDSEIVVSLITSIANVGHVLALGVGCLNFEFFAPYLADDPNL